VIAYSTKHNQEIKLQRKTINADEHSAVSTMRMHDVFATVGVLVLDLNVIMCHVHVGLHA